MGKKQLFKMNKRETKGFNYLTTQTTQAVKDPFVELLRVQRVPQKSVGTMGFKLRRRRPSESLHRLLKEIYKTLAVES